MFRSSLFVNELKSKNILLINKTHADNKLGRIHYTDTENIQTKEIQSAFYSDGMKGLSD